MRIAYVDGPRLRRSLVAACDHAQRARKELNRINVFPVPDGDTGTNLALTVQAISDQLRHNGDAEVGAVAVEAARASVLGARGNCGMMLSHFMLGFADRIRGRARIAPADLAVALEGGVAHVQDALETPVEGTMLTVMRDTAAAAESPADSDFEPFLERLLEAARSSLARTPELLPVLKKAGVVDAGAKGFVSLLEGVVALVRGDPSVPVVESDDLGPVAAAAIDFDQEGETYRYCTEALVRGPDLPDSAEVRAHLSPFGDSIIVIRTEAMLKLHIHTDEPGGVFDYLRRHGELSAHKAEDMRAQHAAVERAASGHVRLARRPVTIVTDSAADLPSDVIRAHGIHVVPLLLMTEGKALRDRVDVDAEEFARRMDQGVELPTTSQPPPGAFLEAYERAAEEGESVVVVALGSALSGTHGSAEAAAQMFEGANIHVFDSKAASSLQALLALKAAELAELALPPDEILRELARVRTRSGVLFTVDRFDRLRASGRVGLGRAWVAGALGVKPILGLTDDGRVVPFGKAFGRTRVIRRVLDIVAASVPVGATTIRFALAHVLAPEKMDLVRRGIRERFGNVEVLVSPATPVVATHTGVGAWALAYMVED